jgi:hypothetical protein
MKTLKSVLVLFSFIGLMLVGCSDKNQSLIAPLDQQGSLQKAVITNFTFTHSPVGFTGEGEINLVPGGKWQIKQFGVTEQFISSDPMVDGIMVHYLSGTIDAVTGEGTCHGSFTVTPTADVDGGVWEGTYEGYRSVSNVQGEWTLPLKVEGHGRGGTIDGMQMKGSAVLTIVTDGVTTLPAYWTGAGEGYYKSH